MQFGGVGCTCKTVHSDVFVMFVRITSLCTVTFKCYMRKYTRNTVRMFESAFENVFFYMLEVVLGAHARHVSFEGRGPGLYVFRGHITQCQSNTLPLSSYSLTQILKSQCPGIVPMQSQYTDKFCFLRNSCLYSSNVISSSPSPSATLNFWVDSISVLRLRRFRVDCSGFGGLGFRHAQCVLVPCYVVFDTIPCLAM